jgi:hypothetical protein
MLVASPRLRAQPGSAPAENSGSARVILLVRTAGDSAVMTRLRAELMNAEWRLLEIRLDERQPAPPLATIAEAQRASAAVRFDMRNGAIELWVARPEGAIQESLAAPSARAHDQVLALRAAEALRARGLPIGPIETPEPPPEPPRSEPTPAPPAPPLPPIDEGSTRTPPTRSADAAASRVALALGPGLAMSPGGLGPVVIASPAVRLELGRWSFSALGFLPLGRTEVVGDEGRARVATWLVGAGVDLEWARSTSVGFRGGLGVGATRTTMSGEAASGYRGVHDSVYAVAPFLRSSVLLDLGQSWRLGPSVLFGASLPRTRVAFGAREAASWGVPFVMFGLTLELAALRWH